VHNAALELAGLLKKCSSTDFGSLLPQCPPMKPFKPLVLPGPETDFFNRAARSSRLNKITSYLGQHRLLSSRT